MQTVKDFVTNPISGIVAIDNTVSPIPQYMITGTPAPVAELEMLPTIADVTKIPVPWRLLWRRPANRLTR